MKNVGFIGIGYMGYGIAKNILKSKNNLFVIANKNRSPIERIVNEGAVEVNSYKELCSKNLDCLFLCVTNTPIAHSIIEIISPQLNFNTIVIDITTHNQNGSINANKIFKSKNISYVECPVMGGPVQAEEGILGGIVGSSEEDFKKAEIFLKMFCKDYFYFGEVGMGAKSKLLNNFLTLGNATLIVHMIKGAKKFNIDLKKLYDVAKLGSGNSAALSRIFDNLLKNDYTGFKFTAKNSHKDLSYILEMMSEMPDAEKLTKVTQDFYKDAVDNGNGESLISELIKK